jgi:hypothetical protein
VHKFVADETMLRISAKLGWTRAEEDRAVAARIVCGYALLLKDYDPASGVPYWLPGEFHADWVSELAHGHRPSMGHSRGKFYVRQWSGDPGSSAPGSTAPPRTNGQHHDASSQSTAERKNLLLSSSAFVAGFEPPDYLMGNVLQRRFIYSFTAHTGHAKTAILLRIAAHIELGKPVGKHEVEKGRVLYLAGENPTTSACAGWRWPTKWGST